jgi:hypothetical protein
MSAPFCAACIRLRAAFVARRHIEHTFAELNLANDALLAAASGLSAALKQGMVKHHDVYELLRVIHLHLKQTIADAEMAALDMERAA